MMGLRRCLRYLIAWSIVIFPVGVILPRSWFGGGRGVCRSFAWEKKLYEKMQVQRWKKRMPDMSRIFPGFLTPKKLAVRSAEYLARMVQETCVAELVHGVLCVAGLYCMRLWDGAGGLCMCLINIMANLPFILIQRYNRPRFIALLRRFEKAAAPSPGQGTRACPAEGR